MYLLYPVTVIPHFVFGFEVKKTHTVFRRMDFVLVQVKKELNNLFGLAL
jgi:hypothetical protein